MCTATGTVGWYTMSKHKQSESPVPAAAAPVVNAPIVAVHIVAASVTGVRAAWRGARPPPVTSTISGRGSLPPTPPPPIVPSVPASVAARP